MLSASQRRTLVTIARRLSLSFILGASVLAPQDSWAQGLPGRVAELERQLGLLQAMVAELASRSEPRAETVDCGAGQTVGAVLTAASNHVGPLVITLQGQCAESVELTRDDVTLQGTADGDGLRAPSGAILVLRVRNARRVVLNRLTLDGNGTASGLSVGRASDLGATDVTIRNSSNAVFVAEGSAASFGRARIEDNSGNGIQADGSVSLFDSHVARNARIGLLVQGGRALATQTVFEANGEGVWGNRGSVVTLGGGAVTGNLGTGVRAWQSTAFVAVDSISGNGFAGVASVVGSSLEVAGLIEGNGRGVVVHEGSVVRIADNSIAGPTTIRNNHGDGIFVSDTSSLHWPRVDVAVTGNAGWGVRCAPSPSVAMVTGSFSAATVSGNAAGQLDCPGLHLP
jgi:hypothetical protein